MAARYGWPLILLHWGTLCLIAAAYGLGWVLEDMPLSPLKLKIYAWHKWVGMLVLAILPLRLLARWLDRLDHATGLVPWEARASALVHGSIYLAMVAVPVSGWLQSSAAGFTVVWFGVLPLPDLVPRDKVMAETLGEVHETGVNLLLVLVAVHAAGALYHHHVRRDAVLARMVPWIGRGS